MSKTPESDFDPVDVPLSKRTIANRKNAEKSTGPRTPEGKAKSSQNAYKHGFTARSTTHFYEDRDRFLARRDDFFKTLAPTDSVEATFVDLMVSSTWRLERLMICDTAILAEKACKATDLFDMELEEDVKKQVRGLRSDPQRFSKLLRLSSKGCEWLITRCNVLIETLELRGFWLPTERDHVLNIFGLDTQDIFSDSLAYDIVEAFVAGGWSNEVNGDYLRLQALIRSPAPEGMSTWEYRFRVDSLAKAILTVDPVPSRAKLFEIMRTEMGFLEKRMPYLLDQEQYLRSLAIDRAAVDTSPEGQLRMRYEAMHRRDLRTAFRDLDLQRKYNADKVISNNRPMHIPPEPPVLDAPNEPISPAVPISKAKDKNARGANFGVIPPLEEPGRDCKRALGVPLKPINELIARNNPTPDSLRKWADEVEAKQRLLDEPKHYVM